MVEWDNISTALGVRKVDALIYVLLFCHNACIIRTDKQTGKIVTTTTTLVKASHCGSPRSAGKADLLGEPQCDACTSVVVEVTILPVCLSVHLMHACSYNKRTYCQYFE